MKVTFQQAYDEIVVPGGPTALKRFEDWSTDQRYRSAVVPFVKGFSHQRLFSIDRHEFDTIRTIVESNDREHALSDLTKSDDIPETKNLNPEWAFQHLFHKYLEEESRLPTWLQWRAWLDTTARELLIVPASRKLRVCEKSEKEREAIRRGLDWRLGLAYYSCMREIDVLIRLRDEHGIHARYHVLADVLYGVDYWVGSNTIGLFISNSEMKSEGMQGRKPRQSTYLDPERFDHYEAVIQKQHTGGTIHLAPDDTVLYIAKRLR